MEFSQEIADRLCAAYAHDTSKSIQTILESSDEFPSYTVIARWRRENPEFEKQYARAREDRAELFAEQIIEIADSVRDETESAPVQAARLMVDSRRWLASKLLAPIYGDKVETVNTSKVTIEDNSGPNLRDQVLSWTVPEEQARPPSKPH